MFIKYWELNWQVEQVRVSHSSSFGKEVEGRVADTWIREHCYRWLLNT